MYSWIMRRLIKLNYGDYLKDELKYLKANMEVQINHMKVKQSELNYLKLLN